MTNVPQVIQQIRTRLAEPLPGLNTQMTMAPPIRGEEVVVPDNARKSAVMMLLYPHLHSWYIPYMRRAEDGRVHGGQVSFPGGRQDPGDPDFNFTALRELEEEFGIPKNQVEILGPLTPTYIPPSNSLVYPILGFISQKPDFRPDPIEVAGVIEVELSQFYQTDRRGIHRVDVFNGYMIDAPGYTVNQDTLIWGGTAMMTAELLEVIEPFIN